LIILKEITELFFKLEGIKIQFELTDHTDSAGKVIGALAWIIIPANI